MEIAVQCSSIKTPHKATTKAGLIHGTFFEAAVMSLGQKLGTVQESKGNKDDDMSMH